MPIRPAITPKARPTRPTVKIRDSSRVIAARLCSSMFEGVSTSRAICPRNSSISTLPSRTSANSDAGGEPDAIAARIRPSNSNCAVTVDVTATADGLSPCFSRMSVSVRRSVGMTETATVYGARKAGSPVAA